MQPVNPTYVIAEAGSTHDGSFQKAVRLVDLAEAIGADAVKFQWVSNPSLLCMRRNAYEYLEAYRTIAFPRSWFIELASVCRDNKIDFLCTVYLPEDITVVEPYVKKFKISSFEARDKEFVGLHKQYNRETIISLGMGTKWYDTGRLDYPGLCRYLHCVSAYPTPVEQINLSVLREGGYDGLSDHTTHPLTGALAVAAGARIIEFHYRNHDADPAGPDFRVARSPEEASEYVRNIRLAEIMMGSGEKTVQPAEEKMMKYRVVR